MRLEIEGLEHRVPVVLYTCTSHSEGSHSANVYWLKESMASPQESEVSFLAKSPHGVPSPPWDLLGGTMSSADSTGSIHASCPCHCCSCGIDSCIPQKRLPLEPMPDTVGGREVGGSNTGGEDENGMQDPVKVTSFLPTSATWVQRGEASWAGGPQEGSGRAPSERTWLLGGLQGSNWLCRSGSLWLVRTREVERISISFTKWQACEKVLSL